MSPALVLWGRIGTGTAVAAALVSVLSPARPRGDLAWPLQPAVGCAAGLALFVLATGRGPTAPDRLVPRQLLAAKIAVLGLLAANEEILWRWTVLGELLFAGPVAALAASALGFALAHRVRVGLHLGTGTALGGLYLLTGGLVASVAAHWAYNALLAVDPRSELPP